MRLSYAYSRLSVESHLCLPTAFLRDADNAGKANDGQWRTKVRGVALQDVTLADESVEHDNEVTA